MNFGDFNNNSAPNCLQCTDDNYGIESDDGVVGLVPYGFNSDSEDSFVLPTSSKTRKKRKQVENEAWINATNKKRRMTGKSYHGKRKEDGAWNYKILKKPKAIKPRCQCKQKKIMKCACVTDAQRQQIFKKFWEMNWKQKQIYVIMLVHSVKPTHPRNRADPNVSRRVRSLKYHLNVNNENVRVCKTFFFNTLSIGEHIVQNWVKKPLNAHNNVSKKTLKTKPEERQNLNLFFDTLPAMESHYCRSVSQKKYLLPEWSSKKMIYDFYSKEWCREKNVRPLSLTLFHTEFESRNLSLFAPNKDQCEICARYNVDSISHEHYSIHLEKKEEARKEKQNDKASEKNVFTVDLQAVLMAPKSNVSSLYYKTKLQIHNLVFYNIINKKGYCFLWNETEGGVNAEEFASIWIWFIENKILPSLDNEEPNKIIFYSDGCGYQNRNSLLSNALLNTAIQKNVVIEQKILETGHSQMEADSVHSTIERVIKKRTVHVPAEYIEICKSARKKPYPYEVHYLTHDFFKKFNKIEFCKSIRPGRGKGDAKVTDIRAIQYNTNGDIYFKIRFNDPWKALPQRINKNVVAMKWCELEQLYQTRRPIKRTKYEDLQCLKLTLPKDYHQFYDDLPHD